jgi:hypothetical protein
MYHIAAVLALVPYVTCQQTAFKPSPGNFPAKGDDVYAGGIFSIPQSELPKYGGTTITTGTESPRTAGQVTSGSGPYPARMLTDSSLPNHVIFAPTVSPGVPIPFLTWANGNCATNPSMYQNFLTEIASYGYIIAADGSTTGGSGFGGAQSKVSDSRDSIDWAMKGGASKYGTIDLEKIATMGHSCGGLEAISTAYHDTRVKRIMMFNIAIFQDDRRYLLQEIKVPVAWFIGGKGDMGYPTVSNPHLVFFYHMLTSPNA